ncbi:MAG: 3-dehydroquinate synthase, partial [Kaistella sp.]
MISFLDQDFSQLNHFLIDLKPSKIIVLVDENTHEYCLPVLLGNLETEIPFEIIEIEAGEDLKTIEIATQLWEILSDFEADRKALMINLGGGVITDMGGFVASTYKRGIRFINLPTTLLGMCDASIGGKTGIDHNFLKNIIGTFAVPEQIFVFPEYLKTLPFPELRSGFAEMLKHGLIADEKHWNDLISIQELSAENIFPFIETSMKIKQNIVEQDFREQHLRKTLNFGHTVGHALESLFLQQAKPIPHGEAVVLGMIIETRLSFLT